MFVKLNMQLTIIFVLYNSITNLIAKHINFIDKIDKPPSPDFKG